MITIRIFQETPPSFVSQGRSACDATQQVVTPIRSLGQVDEASQSTYELFGCLKVAEKLGKLVGMLDIVVKVANRLATVSNHCTCIVKTVKLN
jgi:hypothetical protein